LRIHATAIADNAAWDTLSLGIEVGARASMTSNAIAGCAAAFPRKPTIVQDVGTVRRLDEHGHRRQPVGFGAAPGVREALLRHVAVAMAEIEVVDRALALFTFGSYSSEKIGFPGIWGMV
jgi:hypothetical protein